MAVGRAGDWIGFGVGSWLVMLHVNKTGRFPQVDDILPNHEFARSRLELSAVDAEFLAGVLPRLPCDDTQDDPITLDLNGRVLVRSRESQGARPTEVELTSSRLTGEPVTLNTNRRFVERAVKLGFREAFVYGAESPVLCRDERRRFLWALLDAKIAVPRGDDPIRIESPRATIPKQHSQRERKPSMPSADSVKSTEVPTARLRYARPARSAVGQQRPALRSSKRLPCAMRCSLP